MGDIPLSQAVCVLLRNDHDQILLLKRASHSTTNKGRWELPGGKMDPGESFDQALIREVFEETGLTIAIDHAVGTAEQLVKGWHVVHLVMSGTILQGEIIVSDEHDEYRWVSISEMSTLDLADWFDEYYTRYLRENSKPRGI